jgi:uncharacterized repeat protein (TIGR01451 family)
MKTFISKNLIFSGVFALVLSTFMPTVYAGVTLDLSTLPATNISNTSFTANGYFDANGAAATGWFVYGKSSNNLNMSTSPSNIGSGTGSYSKSISGLSPATTYFYKAMGANASGISTATSIQSVTTSPIIAQGMSASVLPATSITATSAQANGYYTLPSSGLVWFDYGTSSTSLNMSTSPMQKSAGTSAYSQSITSLSPNTTYYVKAHVSSGNSNISSLATQSFKTSNVAVSTFTVSAIPATGITETGAQLNAYLTISGTNTITRFFKYGTDQNNLNQKLNISGTQTSTGPFSGNLTSLNDDTKYFYTACGTDSSGTTICGTAIQSFKTLKINTPTVYACNDGIDNDNDGYVDMNDIGCTSAYDNDEYNYVQPPTNTYACNDGYDNDGDGKVDMNDIGCTSAYDNDEYNYIPNPCTYSCPNPNPYPYPNPYPVNPNPIIKTIIIHQGGTSNTSIDYLDLDIKSRFPNAYTGDTVEYTVTYKNTTKRTTLKNLELEITLPNEFESVSSKNGSVSGGHIHLSIQTLRAGEVGKITFSGRVSKDAKNIPSLTTKAKMTYSTYAGVAGSDTASATIDIYDYSKSVGFGSFLPNTLLEWIILIIVIFALMLIARKLYGEKK